MKIIRPSGITEIWKVPSLHVMLDLSVRRCRTRREVRPVLPNWAGATSRTFWAAESRKSGVAPAQFLVFSDAIFVLAFSPRLFDSREMRLRQSEEVAISEVQNENLTFFTGKPA